MSNPLDDKLEIELDTNKLRALYENRLDLGVKVEQVLKTDGYLILKSLFKSLEIGIKMKRFQTFEEYNSKMDALEIVRELINQFESFVGEAEQASLEIKKIIEADDSTPPLLSLDGEGTDDGEGQ